MAQKILVASGKGGVGKSAFTAIIGQALANKNKKILAIELDCSFRSLDVALGISSSVLFDLGDIISGNASVSDTAKPCPFCKNLSVICASVSQKMLTKECLDLLEKAADDFDVLIFDCPAGITDSMIATASYCDLILILANPDPSSVRAARTTAEKIRNVTDKDIRLIINRCPIKSKNLIPYKSLDDIINQTELQLFGVLWEDPYTRISVDTGIPLLQKSANSQPFDHIAQRILGNRVPLGIK